MRKKAGQSISVGSVWKILGPGGNWLRMSSELTRWMSSVMSC